MPCSCARPCPAASDASPAGRDARAVARVAADPDDDHDVVRRLGHARIPAARIQPALVSRCLADVRVVRCGQRPVDGRRVDDEPRRRGRDDADRDRRVGARGLRAVALPLSRQGARRAACRIADRLSARDARPRAADRVQRAAGRTRHRAARRRARDPDAAVHGEELRGVGRVDRPRFRGSRVPDGREARAARSSTSCCR